jgi:hypothetical protein
MLAGIVIAANDIEKELDADATHLPEHVLFKVSAKTYQTETKQTYPFRYIRYPNVESLAKNRPEHCLVPTFPRSSKISPARASSGSANR